MSKRTWIDSGIWEDTEGLTPTEKAFYLYLLTNEQRNIAGYYKVNLRYMMVDLEMTKEEAEALLMKKQKYWDYDRETQQVLIPKFTRYNIIKSKQQYAKLNAELDRLKPCRLHKAFLTAFEEVNGIGANELIDERFKRKAETT